MTSETEFDIIIVVGNCLEQMERELPVAGIGSFLLLQKQAIANRNKKRIVEMSYQMDVLRMKVLLERYGQLKIRIENSRHRICRIKASSFEQYIEEKTYHSPLGERRLQDGKPSHPTETLGMYGRMQFERERDAQLRAEECRLMEMQALLWQIDSLIEHLDAQEKAFIQRRYADGERVEDFYKELGVSRATAFRRIENAIAQLAGLYNEKYEMAV